METKTATTSIVITIEHESESIQGQTVEIPLSTTRRISVDGKEYYTDKMSTQRYLSLEDPIRNLENFLLDQKQSEGSKIRELVRRQGKNNYSHNLDVMKEHVELVIKNPLVNKEVRSVLDNVSYVLEMLSNDVKEGRVQ